MRRPLLAALLMTACGPTAPTPGQADKAPPAKAAAPAPAPAVPPATAATAATAPEAAPVKREPPLTPEEIQLIESDPNTLTPEQRRARAHALRRKILQNPDSPAAKALEQVRRDVESGALTPTLAAPPPSSPAGEPVLEARPNSAPAPDGKTP